MRRKRSAPAAHKPPRERRTPERPPARSPHSIRHCPGLFCYNSTSVVNADSLIPLLLAYGEDLPGDVAALQEGGTWAAEEAILRTMRAALEGLEAPAPPATSIAAVLAAARTASAVSELAPLRATLAGHDDRSVEAALLRTTWNAVERAGRQVPPPDSVSRVLAAAGAAARASDLASLRSVLFGESGSTESTVEAALLRTTMGALDAVPRSSPPANVVAALVEAAGVAARASELAPVRSAVGVTDPGDSVAEELLLRTTWDAVQRMPREAPPVSVVHAVLSAAHAAIPAPLREAGRLRRAADRPASRESRSFRRFAYLTAAMAFIGLVSVGLWATNTGRSDTTQQLASLDEQPSREPVAPEAPAEAESASPPAVAEGGTPSGAVPASGAGRPVMAPPPATADFRPVEPQYARPVAPPPPPPRATDDVMQDQRVAARETAPSGAGVGLAASNRTESPGAGLAGTPGVTPTWEAGADVRLLSLRLKSLQERAAGIAWDEPPAALGALEEATPASTGFNAVGTGSAPARFQVRVGPPGSD